MAEISGGELLAGCAPARDRVPLAFQPDMNVIWDLAPHDVSIMTYLIDRPPLWVSALGSAHYGKHENQACVAVKGSRW